LRVSRIRRLINKVYGSLVQKQKQIHEKDWSYSETWKLASIPAQQNELAQRQLEQFSHGVEIAEFRTLINCLKKIESIRPVGVLEVGCSGGYNSMIVATFDNTSNYVGVDYSQTFIDLARGQYPCPFLVADAQQLPFMDSSFDVVLSGSVLLHVLDWRRALAESVRVANRWIILHRTPMTASKTRLVKKTAYGVEMGEWHFNERELIDTCKLHGLKLIYRENVYETTSTKLPKRVSESVSYLFEKT
jgi:ubiquinone/menaquinone biosynthesis C-methylase UbiE